MRRTSTTKTHPARGRRFLRGAALLCVPFVLGACSGAAQRPAPNTGVQMSTPHAVSITAGVVTRTLPNGLTVMVKENPAAPVVAVVTYVKTGYFHEPDELAGISHVIEHMFFNGTPTRPGPEDISRETRGYGGVLNAGTIYDRTSYYVVLPSERWREGLAVQADALQNPLFDAATLDNEMKAILQEARRKLDNPSAFGREKMYELAFDQHRMRRWRIGTEEVLQSLTRDDVVQWYTDHYRPQNVVLSIVGDVDAEQVFAEVQALYGAMDQGHLRQRTGPVEPEQSAFRYRRLTNDLQRSYVFVGFHTPGEGHRDNAALQVLATILGTGRSSRLESRLKEELKLVTSIGSSCYQYDDVGLFEVYATVEHNDLSRAPREMFVEIERMKLMGPTPDEVERARSIVMLGEAMGLEEVLGQASTLAAYQAQGDLSEYDRELEALREVTVQDVQRVAQQYLQIERASLLEYTSPRAGNAVAPEVYAQDLRSQMLAAVRTMDAPPIIALGSSVRPREELVQWSERFSGDGAVTGGRHRFELPGGGTLVVEENPTAPTVSAGVYFRGGRVGEFLNISGLTQLMQRVMLKETEGRDLAQLAAEIEGLGTQIGRVSNDDWFGFTTGSLASQFPQAFDVLFDVVTRPKFSPEQAQVEKDLLVAAINALEDQPGPLTQTFTRNSLYGEHPYGLPELGLLRTVQFMAPDRLGEHHEEVVRPESMVISISGDVDAQQVYDFVTGYTSQWKPGGERVPSTAAAFFDPDRFERIATLFSTRENGYAKDLAQTTMMLAYPTVTIGAPETPALDVLQAITGGLGGTFFEEVRGKRGLAYQVATYSTYRMLSGNFGVYVACSPDKATEVRELVVELMNGLALEPPTEEMITRAQNSLAGSWQVGGQTNGARMGRMASYELSGQDLSRIDSYPQRVQAVTRDDLRRIAETYFLDKPYGYGSVAGNTERNANPQ